MPELVIGPVKLALVVTVAALPPILKLATGVVEVTTNGAVPIAIVEVNCVPVMPPAAVIFPVFANVIFVAVPKLLFPLLILIPAPKRKVAAPSLLSTISPSSDNIIPWPVVPAELTVKFCCTMVEVPEKVFTPAIV